MVNLPKYDKYKNSGLEWLGEVPEHWQILRTKNIFRLITNFAPKNNNEELLSVYSDIGVKPRKELEERGNKASTTDGYWIVKKGDFIVNKLLAWMGGIGLSEYDGVTSPAYDILRAYKPVNNKFYHYLFRNPICLNKLKQHSKGIMEMRLRLYFDEFGKIQLPYPPVEEQHKIVNFLDQKTEEIDRAIAHKKRLIELLEEQKNILINQAVTKGLNPNAPMKDTGINELGIIPKSWKLKRLKFAVNKIYDCKNRTPEYSKEGKYFVIRTSNVRSGKIDLENGFYTDTENFIEWTQKGKPMSGELVFTREAPAGEVAIIPDYPEMCLGQRMMGIKPNENEVLSDFLLYFLQSEVLKKYVEINSAGSTVSHLRVSQVFNIPVAYPYSSKEQLIISNYCKKIINLTNNISDAVQKQLNKLTELKQILVAEAVTGKIKI